MAKHLITVRVAQTTTQLICERDESGKIIKMMTHGVPELGFGYYGEWVKFKGETWYFNKNDRYSEDF